MPKMTADTIKQRIIPQFVKYMKDDIPNVKFCISKIIAEKRQYSLIPNDVFNSQLVQPLKEQANDADKDVADFAKLALNADAL